VINEDFPKFDRARNGPALLYDYNKMVEDFGIRFAMDYNLEFVITRSAAPSGRGSWRAGAA